MIIAAPNKELERIIHESAELTISESITSGYSGGSYRNIVPVEPYSGYLNRSHVDDIVTTGDKNGRNLNADGILGWCFNESKVIELNLKALLGNLDQYMITERHEIRHRIHGISDSNIIGHYLMRALDSTAHWTRSIYDRVQKYRQK